MHFLIYATSTTIVLLLQDVAAISPSPLWPTACPFSTYAGKEPRVGSYAYDTDITSELVCRTICEAVSMCGMYRWGEEGGRCVRYHNSISLMREITGFEEDEVMGVDPNSNTGSKDCPAQLTTDDCSSYPVSYDRQQPSTSLYYLRDMYSYSPLLTAAHCQSLCSQHSDCRSVLYINRSWASYCNLYSTTITQLLEEGRYRDVWNNTNNNTHPGFTTYERYCGDQPYHPDTYNHTDTTTATPLVCPQSLGDLHGTSLCLPEDEIHITQLECELVPGCCYFYTPLIPAPLCVRPV